MNTKKITKSSRGRPVGDHDEKRNELLCTAINLLVTDGYAGLSMRNLASKAQVTTGAITYYFSNKSELWLITSCRSANNIMPITVFLPAFIASFFYSA